MKDKLPLVVRVTVPQTKFDPDAVDAEIYCVNTTAFIFSIATKSESFTTVGEEIGTTAEHGSNPKISSLAPGESIRIAKVKGWEWDGHVGITILFHSKQDEFKIVINYDFKGSKADFTFPNSEKKGRIIPPLK